MFVSTRIHVLRLPVAGVLALALTSLATEDLLPRLHAGGVKYVAGVSGFDPNVAGKPITWTNGNVVYFTDQGDAGPMLPQSTANAFVADALARWTSVPTAALIASRGGSLAQDVNGTNVTNQGGISLPADIQPTATNKPLAFVYDNDGQVIDALMGLGASDPSLCATNSVAGGVDRFSTDAHIIHALIIINGRCAQTPEDLAPLKYHLIRLLGQTLGLDWSQANNNVRTGSPFPSNEDYAGFPLMHPTEPFCGSVITNCIANADQLRMDDRAAISRLYPVTPQNISAFTGKELSGATTIRIRGNIYFSDVHGNPGQPMQGVNVVARMIDRNTGQPSRRYVATCVSGFLFRGNAGNHVSGFGVNQRFDSLGSGDTAVEGFYDLGALELPPGETSATYQITVEPIDAEYSAGSSVGPYASGSVTPSGTTSAITIADITAGADIFRDIVMSGSPRLTSDSSEPNSFATPSPVPRSGQWWGSLSGYGDEDFFTFSAKASRTLNLQVTALNENLSPSSSKAQPELGVWRSADLVTPQVIADAFNTVKLGLTELAADVSVTGKLKLGIADYRGDGRPDFLYRARLLYADTVSPERVAIGGGTVAIRGIGFRRGITLAAGGTPANIISVEEDQIVATLPAKAGTQDLTVGDPITGATTTMKSAITFGLLTSDHPVVVSSNNPQVGLGTDAPKPIVIRVVTGDNTTPLAGVSVAFTVSPPQSQFPLCASNSCNIVTDGNGEASVVLTVKSAGANVVTAALSNGKQTSATITGISGLTLTAGKPSIWLLAGSSVSMPLISQLMNSGNPAPGQQVNYMVTAGSGNLSPASAITGANGTAASTLTIANLVNTVTVTACPPSGACATFSVQPVTASSIKLQKISGDNQLLLVGQNAQPISLRVTDSSVPANPLANLPVSISGVAFRQAGSADCNLSDGVCRPAGGIAVSRFEATLLSDGNGVVTYTPSLQAAWGAGRLSAIATAGSSAMQNFEMQIIALQP